MCMKTALDIVTQKFGFQRAQYYTGLTNEQKSLNGFDTAVYFPTNWRVTYTPHKAKFPALIRYGGLQPVAPEYFQRNFLGVFPIKQQPLVDEPDAFTLPRYS